MWLIRSRSDPYWGPSPYRIRAKDQNSCWPSILLKNSRMLLNRASWLLDYPISRLFRPISLDLISDPMPKSSSVSTIYSKGIPSINFSLVSATSGSPSKLHYCILASKWEVTNVNGLLGCDANEVSDKLGS